MTLVNSTGAHVRRERGEEQVRLRLTVGVEYEESRLEISFRSQESGDVVCRPHTRPSSGWANVYGFGTAARA